MNLEIPGEIGTKRLVTFIVGEVWPRFVKMYGENTLHAYGFVHRLGRFFLFPKDAEEGERHWFLGFFTERPDVAAWLLNEFRKESDLLLELDLKKSGKGHSKLGALQYLVLIGFDKLNHLDAFPTLSKIAALEAGAAEVLKSNRLSLNRKFETAKKQVEKAEEKHRREFEKLALDSVPQYKSVGDSYPRLLETSPEAVGTIDRTLRIGQLLRAIVVGAAEIQARTGVIQSVHAGQTRDDAQGKGQG